MFWKAPLLPRQHLMNVILKEPDPVVSTPPLYSVFLSLLTSCIHFPIISSVLPFPLFFPRLRIIRAQCDTCLVAASHRQLCWEGGEATKR